MLTPIDENDKHPDTLYGLAEIRAVRAAFETHFVCPPNIHYEWYPTCRIT